MASGHKVSKQDRVGRTSTVKDWERLWCAQDFPDLNPNSKLGRLIVSYASRYHDADQLHGCLVAATSDETAVAQSRKTWRNDRAPWDVLFALYREVKTGLTGSSDSVEVPGNNPLPYQESVNRARHKLEDGIAANTDLDSHLRQGLLAVTEHAAALLLDEADLHFRERPGELEAARRVGKLSAMPPSPHSGSTASVPGP